MACSPDHEQHLCMLIAKRTPLEELKKIVKNATHVCKNCGRTSNDPTHLCAPDKL